MHTSSPVFVSVNNLTYTRRTQSPIRNLNIDIHQNQCIALTGANGTGKTTTLHILAGLLWPSQGQVLIHGANIHTNPLIAKQSVGFLPEILPLYHELTIFEYLSYIAKIRQIPKASMQDRIINVLQTFNLEKHRSVLINQLSKGQKQRVGIAQAILHQPSVLILDEPTQGLDQCEIEYFQYFLKDYKKKSAIILSTHYLHEMDLICDQTIDLSSRGIKIDDLHHCTA
jgi:ABC-2 type transport system ATP-binding protein